MHAIYAFLDIICVIEIYVIHIGCFRYGGQGLFLHEDTWLYANYLLLLWYEDDGQKWISL